MLPSCPPFEVRHRPYVQSPREGHVYIPPHPPPPKGWLTAAIRAQRRERSFLAAFSTSTTVIVWRLLKKEVIALFDSAFADQSKQDTF